MAELVDQGVAGLMLPIHFGRRKTKYIGGYGDVRSLRIQFLSEKSALTRYLPDCFEIDGEPLVEVYCTMNHDVGWLAGDSYNMLGVDVPCRYKGREEERRGKYCLVLWENLTDPILTGRELQGIPKIYAEIEDHTRIENTWHTWAHYRGSRIVDLSIEIERPMTQDEMTVRRQRPDLDWFGWKYLPMTGEGTEPVSFPTLYPLGDSTWEGSWGRGEIKFHRLTWEQNPTQFHIVNALEEIPIVEYREATLTRGGWPPPSDCWWQPDPNRGPPRLWRPLK
jgi:acetoacetate decarboxylase